MNPPAPTAEDLGKLKQDLAALARGRGFDAIGVSDVRLGADVSHFTRWLGAGLHGEMDYMWKHGSRRTHPEELVPGTVRVLSARMNYWPPEGPSGAADACQTLSDGTRGYISRYALGRDYHKILRHSLQGLADDLVRRIGHMGYRVFVDSGPVLERALEENRP